MRGRTCEHFTNEIRVRTPDSRLYGYSDMVISCDTETDPNDKCAVLNPVVIIEVLSPSTEKFDRMEKALRYRTIPSLRDYVLISQDAMAVEHQSLSLQLDRPC